MCPHTAKFRTRPLMVTASVMASDSVHGYFLFQPVLHDWCNKGCGMYYPVCGMVHIKEPLLLIEKSFLFHYLSGSLPYVRRHITVNKMC